MEYIASCGARTHKNVNLICRGIDTVVPVRARAKLARSTLAEGSAATWSPSAPRQF
jgi:hypothetical protein